MVRGPRLALVLGLLLVLAMLGALWIFSGTVPRPTDALPKELVASDRLPYARAEAMFQIDTRDDSMSWRRMQAGLVFSTRFRNKEFRQTIASCDEAGHGNSLTSGAPDELDVAICDEREFRLYSSGGRVYVEEQFGGQPARVISEVRLPAGIERARAN